MAETLQGFIPLPFDASADELQRCCAMGYEAVGAYPIGEPSLSYGERNGKQGWMVSVQVERNPQG